MVVGRRGAEQLLQVGDGRDGRAPLAAAARFLASPKRERFVYRATLEAVAFVQGRSKGEAEGES